MPISYHTALKAKINNKWIIIDVTWNSSLKGLSITNIWNETSDMKLAVVQENIVERNVDPRNFEKDICKKYTKEENFIRKNFYKLFDELLIKSRK